jgi:glycerol-3-phosphate dehydrogenase (NAD(P)+)
MNKISVIGAGSWGTAVSCLLAKKGYEVILWGRSPDLINQMVEERRNPVYLQNLALPDNLELTSDIEQAALGGELIVLAIPSHAMRQILKQFKSALKSNIYFISLTKGLENHSSMTMSQVLQDELGVNSSKIAVLSGPNHAEEVARDVPSATVIAATDSNLAKTLQNIFMAASFRVYTNSDVLGVELGGAIKNVIAVAVGVSDGLGFGDNTKASLMTRGLAEMTRFGIEMGANPFTFSGLSGIGDLIVTCTSRYSRNRFVGEKIGKGEKLKDIVSNMRMVAEGVLTSAALKEMSKNRKVELPICEQVYAVLYENKDPYNCVSDLMKRGATNEVEELINFYETRDKGLV